MMDALVLAGLCTLGFIGWYFLYWPDLRNTPVQSVNGTIPERNEP